MPRITLDSQSLLDMDKALRTEWLVTNGLGGYASGTVLGLNTRKYHALLVAALNPPVDRCVLLSRLDERIQLENESFDLTVNEDSRANVEGLRFLMNFSVDPFPNFTYNLNGDFYLKKTVFMINERNASIVLYEARNSSQHKTKMTISPLVNFRNFHLTTGKDQFQVSAKQESSGQQVLVQPSTGHSDLILSITDGRYVAQQARWGEVIYRVEAERGESSVDHCCTPGSFEVELEPNEFRNIFLSAIAGKTESEAKQVFSLIGRDPVNLSRLYGEEVKRRTALLDRFTKSQGDVEMKEFLKWLILAADAFIVNRESIKSKSVIAGYHWFNDWGRDSLISLPGLTLVTGRFDDARQILLTFQQYCSNGLVPDVFPDNAEEAPAYNVVDGTLWYFNAVLQFLKYTNDWRFVQEKLWPTLQAIVDNHMHGTLFNIHMDHDGLISHGPQLTWMDAAPDGKPVTPRDGKAVEIQALWFNALKIMQLLARHFSERGKADEYGSMAEKARHSFLTEFWNTEKNCFYDVVMNGANKDASLRPNQILALALDFTMPDRIMREKVFEVVHREFLTPYGLRTLSVSDSRYAGKYRGNRWERDQTYHNGSVWPWLLGPFVTAFFKTKSYDANWRSFAFENFLKPLFTEGLSRSCLGSLSEIFDGDPPHEPNGCIAQAWSVAEPLRAYVQDVLLKRPPYEKQILAV